MTNLRPFIFILLLSGIGYPLITPAETDIHYKGMHFGRAWITINGRIHKLLPGQITKEGVELLSADKNEIYVRVAGKPYKYFKGENQAVPFEEQITLQQDRNGHYWVKGYINNQPATFIIDTGASYVTLSKQLARKMRIKTGSNKIKVHTATKQEEAYLVELDTVRIGHIKLDNVPALITRHNNPTVPLLGMSFLSHIEMSQKGDRMTLTQTDP